MPSPLGDRLPGERCSGCSFYSDKPITISGVNYPGRCTRHPRMYQKEDDGTGPDLWCQYWMPSKDKPEDATVVQGNSMNGEQPVDVEPVRKELVTENEYRFDEVDSMLVALLEYQSQLRGAGIQALESGDTALIAESAGALRVIQTVLTSVRRRLEDLKK